MRRKASGDCSVDGCGRPVYLTGMCMRHYHRVRRHGSTEPTRAAPDDPIAERLASRSREDGECVVWTGRTNHDGYGLVDLGGRPRHAHRVAFEAAGGEIPEGGVVRHTCDNPPCIRPEHLVGGTQLENIRDRVERGRSAVGEKNSLSRFTAEEVLQVDAELRAGASQISVAKRLGMSASTVQSIASGNTWSHLTGRGRRRGNE